LIWNSAGIANFGSPRPDARDYAVSRYRRTASRRSWLARDARGKQPVERERCPAPVEFVAFREPRNRRPQAGAARGYTRAMLFDRKMIFDGRVIKVSIDTVDLPNGVRLPLEIVRHPGGAAAAAIDAEQRICVLRQFRHAAGGFVHELPAGKLEPDESPEVTIRRELAEEAAVEAAEWRSLGAYFSSPGVFTEVIHLYLATGLKPAVAAPETGEVFQVEWWPLHLAVERALNGEITDGKTIIGILRAASRLKIA
jgi:ADP-ribose pyrophosphatase